MGLALRLRLWVVLVDESVARQVLSDRSAGPQERVGRDRAIAERSRPSPRASAARIVLTDAWRAATALL